MKILIPVFDLSANGGNRVLAELANIWVKFAHEVYFVMNHKNETPYFPTNGKIIWCDKKGKIKETHKGKPEEELLKTVYSNIVTFSNFLRKYSKNFDIVLANFSITALPVKLFSRTKNFYYVQAYEPGQVEVKDLKTRIIGIFLTQLSYHLGLKTIVNAEIFKNYKGIRSKIVIPPGLDFSIMHPNDKKKLFKKHKWVIGTIGRIEKFRGTQDISEAVNILRKKGVDVDFRVAFHNVNINCEHKLLQPHGDKNLAEFYRNLDINIYAQQIQPGAVNYPVIEPMACGTAVITTPSYPANNKNSWVVPVKSPEKIAAAVEEIIHNPNAAQEKVEKAKKDMIEFEWEKIGKKFIDVFEGRK
jgi:glycosyltransferase involved in cell wall biosynthesis